MSQKSPAQLSKTRPAITVIDWLVGARERGDLSIGAFGLGALLGTYGKGQRITSTVTTWAKAMNNADPKTVRGYRDELLAKGYLIDLTPDRSARVKHEYALALAVAVGKISLPSEENLATPVGRISPRHEALDEVVVAAQQPIGPVEEDEGDGFHPDGTVDWSCPDNGEGLAETLGVPLASIGPSFWAWIEGLGLSDTIPAQAAADAAVGKRNPVGYFRAILPSYIEVHQKEAVSV